jgi:hypothetical protein
MACDVCGKTGRPLTDLIDAYKTDEIQQVCDGCAKTINKQLWKIRGVTSNIARDLLRRFMQQLRAEETTHD